MSAALTIKAQFGALPVKLNWQIASARLNFDSLLITLISPALGLDVIYTGPLMAELVYVDGENGRSRLVNFVAQSTVADNSGTNRSDWQLQLTLPKSITVKNASYLTVYFALPPGAKAVTEKTVTASNWRVKYGFNGNY